MGDSFWLSNIYWSVYIYIYIPWPFDSFRKIGSIYLLVLIATAQLKTKLSYMLCDNLQRLYFCFFYPDEGAVYLF